MKNLSYYKKLGFENAFSWKQEDFSGFLVWDQVEAFKPIGDLRPGILQGAKKMTQKYNKYKFILDFSDRFFQKLWLKNNKKDKKILFQNSKYLKLILESKKHYPIGLMVEGKKDRLFALKNFIGYLNMNDLSQYVYYYLKEKNIDYLYQLVRKTEEKLGVLKPKYVVLWSDVFPIEKAIILVCKKFGIPTLEVQHGTPQSYTSSITTSGKMVDYLLVWGQYFKDLYIRQKIKKPEEIYILGYPYGIYESKPRTFLGEKVRGKSKEKKKCIVYYLDENDEKYSKELLNLKLKTLTELNRICEKLNIEFFCRPHPRGDRELMKSKLPEVRFTPKDEEIFDTIDKGDIFISLYSTSLIEAAMRSKITLQLMNYPMSVDNFEKLGACTKSFQNIEQLSVYLQKIVRASHLSKVKFKFNNYYVETRYNPGQRFVEILNQINNKKT